MQITPQEIDMLREVANVGMSRAATQLSILLDDLIHVSIPDVTPVRLSEIGTAMDIGLDEEVACVWQGMEGYVEGAAVILFHSEESKVLVNALIGSVPTFTDLDMRTFEHEGMTEIGNIIISSAISAVADMLQEDVRLSVPAYTEESIAALLAHHISGLEREDVQVVLVKTRLSAMQRSVTGSLMILLGLHSAEALFRGLDDIISGRKRVRPDQQGVAA